MVGKYANVPEGAPERWQWPWSVEDTEILLFLRREGLRPIEIAVFLDRSLHTVYRRSTELMQKQDALDTFWEEHRCSESGCREAWIQIQKEAGVGIGNLHQRTR